jgi:hypothetical protein
MAASPLGRRATARSRATVAAKAASSAPLPAALLFDCDGVLVDTERDGHRVSFNRAFQEMGLGEHDWGVDLYGKVRAREGGRERRGVVVNWRLIIGAPPP